ncbi:hypothetical protein QL285_063020 [Trifolium repens]|nr:hypothetical protein QL285_063020 [Trifolium repens]
MTKTGLNTKENLPNRRKASRQAKNTKRQEKTKNVKILLFIVPRWFPSCHDGSYLLAKTSTEENLKKICSSYYDGPHRGMMALLGNQADETHRISYNSELNLPIVLRWTHRSTMAC